MHWYLQHTHTQHTLHIYTLFSLPHTHTHTHLYVWLSLNCSLFFVVVFDFKTDCCCCWSLVLFLKINIKKIYIWDNRVAVCERERESRFNFIFPPKRVRMCEWERRTLNKREEKHFSPENLVVFCCNFFFFFH